MKNSFRNLCLFYFIRSFIQGTFITNDYQRLTFTPHQAADFSVETPEPERQCVHVYSGRRQSLPGENGTSRETTSDGTPWTFPSRRMAVV